MRGKAELASAVNLSDDVALLSLTLDFQGLLLVESFVLIVTDFERETARSLLTLEELLWTVTEMTSLQDELLDKCTADDDD